MKNKEAILSKLSMETGDLYYESKVDSVFDGEATTVKRAMDEYAREVAIEFSRYVENNFQPFMASGKYLRQIKFEIGREWPDIAELELFTKEELYNKFLSEQSE